MGFYAGQAASVLGIAIRTIARWKEIGWLDSGPEKIKAPALIAAAHRSLKSPYHSAARRGRIKAGIARLEAGLEALPRQPRRLLQVGQLAMVPVEVIQLDPSRYQFRLAHSATGTTNRLKGASRFRPELAGVLLVWMDPTGVTWLCDGHHRLALAARCGVGVVACLYIEAADPIAARQIAAVANLAAGHASAIDAARYLRDEGSTDQLRAYGVSLSTGLIQQATQLLGLAPELFGKACTGQLSESFALALAMVQGHPQQLALLAQARKRCWKIEKLKEAASLAEGARVVATGDPADLFGGMYSDPTTDLDALLSIRTEIRKQLNREVRALSVASGQLSSELLEAKGCAVFDRTLSQQNKVESTKVLATFEKLAQFQGPIATMIAELAAQVEFPDMPASRVVATNLDTIRDAIEEALGLT